MACLKLSEKIALPNFPPTEGGAKQNIHAAIGADKDCLANGAARTLWLIHDLHIADWERDLDGAREQA